MNISRLVQCLEKIKGENGDLPVLLADWFECYSSPVSIESEEDLSICYSNSGEPFLRIGYDGHGSGNIYERLHTEAPQEKPAASGTDKTHIKVVISPCYGGYGLSKKAVAKYYEIAGNKVFYYNQAKWKHREGVNLYERVVNLDGINSDTHATKADFGRSTSEIASKPSLWEDPSTGRDDEILVEVVETIGSKDASGDFAELEVMEIPVRRSWYIDEYDGWESVEFK